MLSKILNPNASLPKFIVGSDKNALKTVLRQFHDNTFTDFSDSNDGILELQQLKNILVFYDEKGNFNPLNDLKYIDQMKSVYEHKPVGYEELTEEKWQNFRNAYKVKKSPVIITTQKNQNTKSNTKSNTKPNTKPKPKPKP